MGLLDTNYQDQRLTASQKKKIKPAIQGGGYNYLGKQEEVTVPRKWLSNPDHVVAELAYITPREKKVLIDLNMYGSLDGKPNNAPGGLPSLQGDMGGFGGGGGSGGGGSGGGGGDGSARESYGGGGQYGSGSSSNSSSSNNGGGSNRESYGSSGQYGNTVSAPSPGDTGGEGGFNPQDKSDTQFGETSPGRDPSKQYETPIDLTIEQKETLEEQRKQAQYAISPSTDPKNQVIKTLLNLTVFPGLGNLYTSYLDATALGYPLSASFPDLSDIFSGGDISQQMENIQSIQGGNGDDGGGGIGQVSTPVAPVAPSNNLPPSMVNQYFANLNLGQALSSDLQTSYNNAKNTMNNLLGINPMSQQFGYSADPYGGLMASNLTTNPFNIDYLRTRGLI